VSLIRLEFKGYLMSKLKIHFIILIFGLISCDSAERNSEKTTINDIVKTNPINKDTVLMPTKITDPSPKKLATDTVLLHNKQSKKRRIKKNEEPVTESISAMNEPSYQIIPGSIRNTFTKNNDVFNFSRIVKNDEDRRIGCSGGGNSLSFTVKTLRDTFLFENEMLKTLNMKYTIEGGIYLENGERPNKGKISGILLSNNSWQIEMNVWIKTRDMQNNKEFERQIILNEKFTQ
jgi:hypothetical protein